MDAPDPCQASDLYERLGVAPDADPAAVAAAYRAQARRWHPDANPSPEAEARMVALNEAAWVLGDPDRRRDYDRQLGVPSRRWPPAPPGAWPGTPAPGPPATPRVVRRPEPPPVRRGSRAVAIALAVAVIAGAVATLAAGGGSPPAPSPGAPAPSPGAPAPSPGAPATSVPPATTAPVTGGP